MHVADKRSNRFINPFFARRRLGRRGLALCGAVLLAGAARAAVEKPIRLEDQPDVTYRYPVVTAPRLLAPPTMDGQVDKAEWSAAAQAVPLLDMQDGLMLTEPSLYWVGYTDEAFYLAFRFMRPPEAGAPRSRGTPGNVWGDDSLELFLRPKVGARSEYNFVMNALGVRSEGFRNVNTDKAWTAPWEGHARLIENGWEGEVRIPFASLDQALPQPGETWEMLVTHVRRTPSMQLGMSAFLREWSAVADFGYLRFGGAGTPAVRVVQAGAVSPAEGGALLEIGAGDRPIEVTVQGALYRPKTASRPYFALVEEAADPLGGVAEGSELQVPAARVMERVWEQYEQVAAWEETVAAPAGAMRRLALTTETDYGDFVFHYRVQDAASGQLLAGETLPFAKRPPLAVNLEPFLLLAEVVAVEADYRRVDGFVPEMQVVVELRAPGMGAVLERVAAPANPATRRSLLNLPVAGRLGQSYDLRVALLLPDGAPLIEQVFEQYALPTPPDWWGNDYGRIEALQTVPAPWTPIEPRADGFSVWGRSVQLGADLLPVRIDHHAVPQTGAPLRTEPILAGPMALTLRVGDQAATYGAPVTTFETSWLLRREVPVVAPGVTGRLVLEVEFDGLMKYTLELAPSDGAQPVIEELVLAYRLPRAQVTHYNHGNVGTDPRNLDRYATGTLTDLGLKSRFTNKLWLGGDTLGLDWVAEWDRWWAPRDHPDVLSVAVEGAEVRVRIAMVDGAQPQGVRPLTEPVHYQWAFLPTPVKPMQDKYRSHNLRYAQGGINHDPATGTMDEEAVRQRWENMVAAGVNAYNVWAWSRGEYRSGVNLWNPDFAQPGLNPAYPENLTRERLLGRAVELAKAAGIRWFNCYMLWASPPRDWPGVEPFISEMRLHPVQPSFGGYLFEPNRVFQDWYMATLKRTIERTGINGMYQDSSANPRFSANLYTGSGWLDDRGQVRGRYPIFASREFHRRIWLMFHQEFGQEGLIYSHNTHLHFPVVESFVDIHHAGEGSKLVQENMIPKWYGYPIGNPTTWTRWNHPPYDATRMFSWRMALLMDVDLKTTPAMVTEERFINQRNYDEKTMAIRHIWDARAQFPWAGSIWVPAWRSAEFVRTGHEDSGLNDIMAALHYQPGQAVLLTVASFLDEPWTGRIRPAWDRLGLDPQTVEILDPILGTPVALEGDEIPLEILDNRWRLLLIRAVAAQPAPVP